MAPPVGLTPATIEIGGLARRYWVAPMPQGHEASPPILVVLHGAGGEGMGMAALSGLDRRGPAAGFVTVFPDGQNRVWSDGRQAPRLRRRQGVDDVGFLQGLIDELFARTGSSSVFLAGMSNGALMAEHVARHGLLDVSGIALVAGPGTQSSRASMPRPARPATAVIFAGTADPLIPYRGGSIGPLGRLVSRRPGSEPGRGMAVAAEVSAADWAAANGVSGPPLVEQLPTRPGDLSVTRTVWRSDGGRPVALYRVDGGGHIWPGAPPYLPERIIGRSCLSLDATGIILDWFRSTGRGRRENGEFPT